MHVHMGVGRFFFHGVQTVDFSRGSQINFPGGAKSGEISFIPLQNKKTIFFANNLIEKYQISKSREVNVLPCPPSSNTHSHCM